MTLSTDRHRILVVLTVINFLNYIDRQVIFPLFHNIQEAFHLTDYQLGLLGTVFMLVHSLATVPLGIAADKYSRKVLITASVVFWSVVSFASGLAQSFRALLFTRSLVGVGEAGYAPAATAMISDNFPEGQRARAQGVFNIGMFAGGTLGVMLGGVIAYYFHDWRLAFFIASIPGFILAYFAMGLTDQRAAPHSTQLRIASLFHNPAYLWVLVSGIFVTFATGAFVSWGVEFVRRYKVYNLRDASLLLGVTMLAAGLVGIVLGSWVADHLQKRGVWGRSLTVACSLTLAGPIMYWGVAMDNGGLPFFASLFLGTTFLSFYNGPVTAVIHDVVPDEIRATAFAVYLLVVHLLGDTFAPAVVGIISDSQGLQAGLLWSCVMVFFAGLIFFMVVKLVANSPAKLTETKS